MMNDHSIPLTLAYALALGGWCIAARVLPGVWPRTPFEPLARPWREFIVALLGVVGVLVIGQLWTRGIRLPEEGTLGPLTRSINQLLIFSPMLVVMLVRRQPWTTAWLPRPRIAVRLLVGLLLAALAVTVYSVLREGADSPWTIFGRIWHVQHLDTMVQVFLEDLTIAILFVRLASAIGRRRATVIVACLFAAGHIPVMVAQGVSLAEMAGLLRDAGLGIAVILVLQRSRDIVWLWCVHFCLDMTQFAGIIGVG